MEKLFIAFSWTKRTSWWVRTQKKSSILSQEFLLKRNFYFLRQTSRMRNLNSTLKKICAQKEGKSFLFIKRLKIDEKCFLTLLMMKKEKRWEKLREIANRELEFFTCAKLNLDFVLNHLLKNTKSLIFLFRASFFLGKFCGETFFVYLFSNEKKPC